VHPLNFQRGKSMHPITGALLFCIFLFPSVIRAQSEAGGKSAVSPAAAATYAQGIQALQQGDLAAAQAGFEKAIRLAPLSPEAHNSLGWVYLAQRKTQPAIAQFNAALRLKPNFEQAHMNLATALVQKGDAQSAVREAREAVRLAPTDSEAHRTLGHALSFSGDLGGASQELSRAIQLEPGRAELHDELGSLFMQQSRPDEAAVEFAAGSCVGALPPGGGALSGKIMG
jgi:Tfp pilus assembly protein PilF